MLKRIKNIWKLSALTPQKFDKGDSLVALVDNEHIGVKQDDNTLKIEQVGNGKAEFFGEPTEKEELEWQREQAGTLPWYKRILK